MIILQLGFIGFFFFVDDKLEEFIWQFEVEFGDSFGFFGFFFVFIQDFENQ